MTIGKVNWIAIVAGVLPVSLLWCLNVLFSVDIFAHDNVVAVAFAFAAAAVATATFANEHRELSFWLVFSRLFLATLASGLGVYIILSQLTLFSFPLWATSFLPALAVSVLVWFLPSNLNYCNCIVSFVIHSHIRPR